MQPKARGRPGSGRPARPGYRNEVLKVLTRLLADRPQVTAGKMFGFPAFYTAGKLFACVYGDGVGLKLPQDTVQQLEGKPGITPFQPYAKPKMREWIHIRHDRASSFSKHAGLIEESIAFVVRAAANGQEPRRAKRRARPASK